MWGTRSPLRDNFTEDKSHIRMEVRGQHPAGAGGALFRLAGEPLYAFSVKGIDR
jgi:hypothetical protein